MNKLFTISIAAAIVFSSCKRETKDENTVSPKYDYTSLDTSSYSANFKNSVGDTTSDRSIGRAYFTLHSDLRTKIGKSTSEIVLSADLLNLYSTGLNIKSITATSLSAGDMANSQADIEKYLTNIANTSVKFADTAGYKKAGVAFYTNPTTKIVSKYLVDTNGIEWSQVAQKALIGAYQLDYICNILLSNTSADNSAILSGTKQTQLAQNWDKAYGILTSNKYLGSAYKTTPTVSSGETQLASYSWEYHPEYPQQRKALSNLNYAFLTGRKAVENKDIETVKSQAETIRKTLEKVIAIAALGYIGKWKTISGATEQETAALRMHALGEGLGFIYSLRFCKLNGCDVTFSDDILTPLITTGHWELTNDQVLTAETKIKAKFGL